MCKLGSREAYVVMVRGVEDFVAMNWDEVKINSRVDHCSVALSFVSFRKQIVAQRDQLTS